MGSPQNDTLCAYLSSRATIVDDCPPVFSLIASIMVVLTGSAISSPSVSNKDGITASREGLRPMTIVALNEGSPPASPPTRMASSEDP